MSVKITYTCNHCKGEIKGKPLELFLPNPGYGTTSTGPRGWNHHFCDGQCAYWYIETNIPDIFPLAGP